MKLWHALLVLTICAGVAAPVRAQTPAPEASADVVGKWDATFTTPDGPIPGRMVLKKDGDKIVGSVGSKDGDAPAEAELKGKDLSVWFTYTHGGDGPMAITLTGRVEGDSIKGSINAGGNIVGDWTATRHKDDPNAPVPSTASTASTPSLTGTWTIALELPNISATPTLTLKQDGETLSGEYVSQQYGKFPVTGTVKGADVTFRFAMTVEGNSYNVTYKGTADRDAMKGSVNVGDMMDGTFSATRKK
jgi:hypothetical protein